MCRACLWGHLGREFVGGPAWSKLALQDVQGFAPTFTIDSVSFESFFFVSI